MDDRQLCVVAVLLLQSPGRTDAAAADVDAHGDQRGIAVSVERLPDCVIREDPTLCPSQQLGSIRALPSSPGWRSPASGCPTLRAHSYSTGSPRLRFREIPASTSTFTAASRRPSGSG